MVRLPVGRPAQKNPSSLALRLRLPAPTRAAILRLRHNLLREGCVDASGTPGPGAGGMSSAAAGAAARAVGRLAGQLQVAVEVVAPGPFGPALRRGWDAAARARARRQVQAARERWRAGSGGGGGVRGRGEEGGGG